jgi:GNAT superfamily N-acetyltransferase
VASDDPAPEVALVVDDAWQGQGLGSILLDELLHVGSARGFATFRADVLAENRRMLRLLARLASFVERSSEQGVVSILFRPRRDPLGSSTRATSSLPVSVVSTT